MLLAIIFPWLSFMFRGHIFKGILCLILQITLIGWLPAALWACFTLNGERSEKKLKRTMEEYKRAK